MGMVDGKKSLVPSKIIPPLVLWRILRGWDGIPGPTYHGIAHNLYIWKKKHSGEAGRIDSWKYRINNCATLIYKLGTFGSNVAELTKFTY